MQTTTQAPPDLLLLRYSPKPTIKTEYVDFAPTAHIAGKLRITINDATRTAVILRSPSNTLTVSWSPYPFNTSNRQHVTDRAIVQTWIALRRFYLWAHGTP